MDKNLMERLKKINFSSCLSKNDVWAGIQSDVEELNAQLRVSVLDDLSKLEADADAKILGKIFLGDAGVGKTHFIASLRRKIKPNVTFVYADMTGIGDFWQTILHEFLTSLARKVNGREQYLSILDSFSSKKEEEILSELYEADSDMAVKSRDILRAFLLFCSEDIELKFIGSDWLNGLEPHQSNKTQHISFGSPKGNPRDVVLALAWFASFRGPTLFAIDQIDMIASDMRSIENSAEKRDSWLQERIEKNQVIVRNLMNGMASLVMDAPRSLVLMTCLDFSFDILKQNAISSSMDRFDTRRPLLEKPSSIDCMQSIVSSRIAPAFEKISVPYPSYPFKREFFEKCENWTPRKILQLCERSLQNMFEAFDKNGEFREIENLAEYVGNSGDFSNVDENFKKNIPDDAESKIILDANDVGEEKIGHLLYQACIWFVEENGLHEKVVVEKMNEGKNPALHARVIITRDDASELVICLRSLLPTHYSTFRSRLDGALRVSGISSSIESRRLAIFSNSEFPKWPTSKEVIGRFKNAKGTLFVLSHQKLNLLLSLEKISTMSGFFSWLQKAKPLKNSDFFKGLFDGIFRPKIKSAAPAGSPGLFIGNNARMPIYIPMRGLCEHTVILASSGSGKTVLLRRIIEQAALHNIPAIVIDAGNDLARLGTPRVETEDNEYFKKADVVVWTPGLKAGRDINFAPLPDFAPLRDDETALSQAVTLAEDTLSKVVASGNSVKSRVKRGLLHSALQFFASGGTYKPKFRIKDLFVSKNKDSRLLDFINLLEAMPEELQLGIKDAGKLAKEMADILKSERQRNPNFQDNPPFDIGELLNSKVSQKGGKVRVSVINLSGLQTIDAQCSFINQLAANLFLYIRQNPSKSFEAQAILAIDEAQDFMPAGSTMPVCRTSLLRLVAHGRKYGLALVFATQNPRNLDYKAMGNIGTYFLGRTQAPNTVKQLTELIESWGAGGKRYSVGCLEKGEFYIRSTSGHPEPIKVSVPMCVSSHPTGETLTQEEILKLSRKM